MVPRAPRTFEELARPIMDLVRLPNCKELIRQLPVIGPYVDEIDERELEDLELIFSVMTERERVDPDLKVAPSRRMEIARKAECTLESVNSVFDQYDAAREFFANGS